MKDNLRIITPAIERAVSLNEARRHLRVEDTDSDDLINLYLNAAEQSLAHVGRAFRPATYALDLYQWGCHHRVVELPMPPLRSIVSVVDGNSVTIDSSNYSVTKTSEGRGILLFASGYSWSPLTSGQVRATITFTAGYDEVPAALRAAILLTIATLFDNRADVAPINIYSVPGVDRLIAPFREQFV